MLGNENSARVDKHANQLATIPLPSNATEAGGCTERERERVEGALHNNRYIFLMYGVGWAWIYGFTGYGNGLIPLFTISICMPWERSHSAFGFEFLLQMDEAPA
ncbi:hypothetical protein N7472_010975 [Penicillium cf. griseofulvum]|uniref:Uncharacterized protein n=1 Tax=Penicillium cf. griseofulvum TaxID=2972120 RepID=A0A9W9J0F6_9EURO|nr:hypothetical protein N7472_010975 [Penicillium cf. griseofulvum]